MIAFGADFTFTYYPLEDNESLSADDIIAIASLLDSAHIFYSETRPTRADVLAGTGADETINSWTNNTSLGFDISVSAIDDPDPSGSARTRVYWIGINFRLEAGEQIQTVIKALPMERIEGHIKLLDISDLELKGVWPAVADYTTGASARENFETEAKKDLKRELTNRQIEWAKIVRPDDLRRALIYKTLFYIARSQIQGAGDKFEILMGEFKTEYDAMISGVKIAYDSDGDGQADDRPQSASSAVIIRR